VGGEVMWREEGMVEKSVILLHWQPKLAWYLGSGDHTVDTMYTYYSYFIENTYWNWWISCHNCGFV
jgi:hypothetical protein